MKEIIYVGAAGAFGVRHVNGHPQFAHCMFPPEGYIFTKANTLKDEKRKILFKKAVGEELDDYEEKVEYELLARREALNDEINKFVAFCKENNISEEIYLQFLRIFDQRGRGEEFPLDKGTLSFFPSFLFSLQATPFVVEIEDIYTLLSPYAENGYNAEIDIVKLEGFQVVQYLLGRSECKCILTHMRSTKKALQYLFTPEIRNKVEYVPLGVSTVERKCKTYQEDYGKTIRLLFTSSWSGYNFEVRGGLDTLVAFDHLCDRYSNVELIVKCVFTSKLPQRCRDILARRKDKIHIISEKISDEEMDQLMRSVDIFLLPSAHVHIVSLLNAMAYGIPVIASDGWGIEEYITDGYNGSIVRGRYGKVSWEDENGILRENYEDMFRINEDFASNLAIAIEKLILNNEYRFNITRNAMEDIQGRFSLQQWNNKLGAIFDKCYQKIEIDNKRDIPFMFCETEHKLPLENS